MMLVLFREQMAALTGRRLGENEKATTDATSRQCSLVIQFIIV